MAERPVFADVTKGAIWIVTIAVVGAVATMFGVVKVLLIDPAVAAKVEAQDARKETQAKADTLETRLAEARAAAERGVEIQKQAFDRIRQLEDDLGDAESRLARCAAPRPSQRPRFTFTISIPVNQPPQPLQFPDRAQQPCRFLRAQGQWSPWSQGAFRDCPGAQTVGNTGLVNDFDGPTPAEYSDNRGACSYVFECDVASTK